MVVEVWIHGRPRRRVPVDRRHCRRAHAPPRPAIPGNQVRRSSACGARPGGTRPGGASTRGSCRASTGYRGQTSGPGPGWWRGPVARRIAARPLLDRPLVAPGLPGVIVLVDRAVATAVTRRVLGSALRGCDGSARRRRRRGPTGPGVRGLPPRPLLERRADRERAREAVRLLVRQRARGGIGLGVATVAMVRSVRPLVPLVLERHERARRRSIGAGQPTLGHRGDDTRGASPQSAARADPLRV